MQLRGFRCRCGSTHGVYVPMAKQREFDDLGLTDADWEEAIRQEEDEAIEGFLASMASIYDVVIDARISDTWICPNCGQMWSLADL